MFFTKLPSHAKGNALTWTRPPLSPFGRSRPAGRPTFFPFFSPECFSKVFTEAGRPDGQPGGEHPGHYRDTTRTPPGHHRDTTGTPPSHHRDTTRTPPGHYRDTTGTPPGTPPGHRDTTGTPNSGEQNLERFLWGSRRRSLEPMQTKKTYKLPQTRCMLPYTQSQKELLDLRSAAVKPSPSPADHRGLVRGKKRKGPLLPEAKFHNQKMLSSQHH